MPTCGADPRSPRGGGRALSRKLPSSQGGKLTPDGALGRGDAGEPGVAARFRGNGKKGADAWSGNQRQARGMRGMVVSRCGGRWFPGSLRMRDFRKKRPSLGEGSRRARCSCQGLGLRVSL